MLAALLAGAVPPLLAYSLSPSATMLNQCAAVALWGWWVVAVAPRERVRGLWPLLGALAILGLAVVLSSRIAGPAKLWPGALPNSLALSALGLIAGAALLAWAGAAAAQRADGPAWFEAFAAGLLAAGVLSSGVALEQDRKSVV